VLRTDVVRQKMAAEAAGGGNENAKYSDDARQRVYEELLQRAVDVHAQRIAVVLDGTFAQLSAIRQAWELVGGTQSVFLAIECSCRAEVAHARIRQRLAEGRDASEAGPEVHDQQRAEWEAWPEELPQIRVDTEEPLPRQVERVMRALRLRFRQ
jgi:predicted kinase